MYDIYKVRRLNGEEQEVWIRQTEEIKKMRRGRIERIIVETLNKHNKGLRLNPFLCSRYARSCYKRPGI